MALTYTASRTLNLLRLVRGSAAFPGLPLLRGQGFTMYVFFKWRFGNSLITKIQGISQRNAAQKLKNLKSKVV
jgi:hypothetical protein